MHVELIIMSLNGVETNVTILHSHKSCNASIKLHANGAVPLPES